MVDSYRPNRRDRGPPPPPPDRYRPARKNDYDSHRSGRFDDSRGVLPNGDAYYPRDQGGRRRSRSPKNHGNSRASQPNSMRSGDFSFRSQPQNVPDFSQRVEDEGRRPRRNNKDRRQRQYGGRKFQNKRGAADRQLLQGERAPTPEQYEAMSGGPSRFKAPAEEDSDDAEDSEFPAKGSRSTTRVDGSEIPKWSNPDPYTALPPPEEATGKRTNVLDIIRKARNEAVGGKGLGAGEGDEFISFSLDGADDDRSYRTTPSDSDADPPTKKVKSGNNEPSAIKFDLKPKKGAGRKFSHLDALHPDRHLPPPPPPPPPAEHLPPLYIRPNAAPSVVPPPPPPPDGPRHSIFDRIEPVHSSEQRKASKRSREGLDDELSLADNAFAGTSVKSLSSEKLAGLRSIDPAWRPKKGLDPVPWFDELKGKDASEKFHHEVVAFYHYTSPQAFENDARLDLAERVSQYFAKEIRGCTVRYFGSFAAGVYLPNADMDFVLLTSQFMNGHRPTNTKEVAGQLVRRLAKRLKQSRNFASNVLAIPFAKVPIIKYVDNLTNLKVDISFENDSGLIANDTYDVWKREFSQLVPLVTIIKHFLIMRSFNDASTGGLGGFSVTCLVVSLLQHMPERNDRTLGELLMSFFQFYGTKFDIDRQGITVNPPGYIDRNLWRGMRYQMLREKSLILLVDPNNRDNNLCAPSYNAPTILKSFAAAYKLLERRLQALSRGERPTGSVLGELFAGDYSEFEDQRAHLRKLRKAPRS